MKYTKEQIEESRQNLLGKLKPGSEVCTILRRVSASGMSRCISLVMVHDGIILPITYDAAMVMGDCMTEVNGIRAIKVPGGGMDMGFHLVYSLGRALFPDGFRPVDAGRSHGRNGASPDDIDTDGGYALVQRWL